MASLMLWDAVSMYIIVITFTAAAVLIPAWLVYETLRTLLLKVAFRYSATDDESSAVLMGVLL